MILTIAIVVLVLASCCINRESQGGKCSHSHYSRHFRGKFRQRKRGFHRFLGGENVEMKADFTSSDVHKQFGISFRTPRFPNPNITERVKVWVQLYKPTDQVRSYR
jgi:Rel homology dimerisation domain